ncbi:MAG: hypothetical protein ACI802_002093 [Candidatus Paceibacteria bacterium]|jgi:hypothetical protein
MIIRRVLTLVCRRFLDAHILVRDNGHLIGPVKQMPQGLTERLFIPRPATILNLS